MKVGVFVDFTGSLNSSTTLNGGDRGWKSYNLLSVCWVVGHFAGLNGEFVVQIRPLKSTRNKTKGGHGGLRGTCSRLIEV